MKRNYSFYILNQMRTHFADCVNNDKLKLFPSRQQNSRMEFDVAHPPAKV